MGGGGSVFNKKSVGKSIYMYIYNMTLCIYKTIYTITKCRFRDGRQEVLSRLPSYGKKK